MNRFSIRSWMTLIATAALPSVAIAGNYTWNGSSSMNWGSSTNWTGSPARVPGAADFAIFAHDATVNLDTARSIEELEFTGGTVTIQNAAGRDNPLTITGTGYGIFGGSGAGAININVDLIVGASQTWENNSTGTLTINGDTSINGVGLTIQGSSVIAIGGAVSGAGSITKSGSGTLRLTGVNTYANGTFLNGGIVSVDNDSNLGGPTSGIAFNGGTLKTHSSIVSARAVTLTPAGGTIDTDSTDSIFSGSFNDFGGAGSLTKIGAGNLNLTGTNSYSGGTTIYAGAVNFVPSALPHSGNITVNSGGTLVLGVYGTYGVAGQQLTMNGGTIEMTAAGSGNLTEWSGNVVMNNDTTITRFGSPDIVGQIDGTISGSHRLITNGTINLLGNNSYTGGTTINSGIVALGSNSSLGTGAVAFNAGIIRTLGSIAPGNDIDIEGAGGTFDTGVFSATFGGSFTGSGALTKTGSGTMILAGSGSWTGGTTVSQGYLQGDTNNLKRSIAVAAGAGVIFNQGIDGTFNTGGTGALSGAGSLTKTGAATLTLLDSGSFTNYSYSGGTYLNQGLISVDHDSELGNAMGALVFNGGGLKLTTSIGSSRPVTLNSLGGTIETDGNDSIFGGSFGGAGSLTKNGARNLNLTGSNSYGGGTTINAGAVNFVPSALPHSGKITVNSAGKLVLGVYGTYGVAGQQLIMNGGTIEMTTAGSGNLTEWSGNVVMNNDTTITRDGSPNIVGQIDGTISGPGRLITNGTIKLLGNNSYTGGTTINGGSLLVSADTNLGNLAGSMIFAGGTLQTLAAIPSTNRNITLSPSGGGTIDTNGFNSTFNGKFTGSGSLTKIGGGKLTLINTNNDYGGGTFINGGTLSIGAESILGTGPLTIAGGVLQTTAGFTFLRGITLNSPGGTIDTNGLSPTFVGAFSGNGSLTKIGNGTLTLTNINSYSAGTFLNGGTLSVGADYSLGNVMTSGIAFNGGMLQTYASVTSARAVTLTPAGGTIDVPLNVDSMFSGSFVDFGGAGSLTKIGSGIFELSGANGYSGGTTINAGTLSAIHTGSLPGYVTSGHVSVHSGATLAVRAGGSGEWDATSLSNLLATNAFAAGSNLGIEVTGPNTFIYSGDIGITQPAKGLVKSGTGILTLSGNNTYNGGTTISGGTLQVGDGVSNGLISGNVVDNAVLSFANHSAQTYGGTISGTGSVKQIYAYSTLTLSGNNTYAGGTMLNGGVVCVSTDSNLGAPSGSLTFAAGTATLRTLAGISSARPIIVKTAGTIDTNGFDSTFSGDVSGTGTNFMGDLDKTGGGTLHMSGSTPVSGFSLVLTVNNGTLAHDGGTTTGYINNNSIFQQFGGTVGSSTSHIDNEGLFVQYGGTVTGPFINHGTYIYVGGTFNAQFVEGNPIHIVNTPPGIIVNPPTFSDNSTTAVPSGLTIYRLTSGSPTIGTGARVIISNAAEVQLDGTVSPFASGSRRVDLAITSTAMPGLLVTGQNQVAGAISGTGDTEVAAGGNLTVTSFQGNSLTIGGTIGKPASMTIDASDAAGNPLDEQPQPGGLVVAGSLAPSGPFSLDGGGATRFDGSASPLTIDNASMSGGFAATSSSSVPEPSTLLLLIAALGGALAAVRYRRSWRVMGGK